MIMQVTAAVKAKITAELNRCLVIAERTYGRPFRMPEVTFKGRGGRVAGSASYTNWTIDLHPGFLMQESSQHDMIYDTVPHELAHLITFAVYPETHTDRHLQRTRSGKLKREKREVHGPRWQSVMRVFGLDPARCHNYDNSAFKIEKPTRRVFAYKCANCGHILNLTALKHGRLQKNPFSIYHRGCKGLPLEYVGKNEPKAVATTPAAKPAAPQRAPRTGTKMEQCWDLYCAYQHQYDRGMMIAVFVNEVGCTAAGASTYYASIKKRYLETA